jgi:spore coat polysaccharide biosynthesis protein SpsF
MKIIAIIHARMSSSRLPGKVLKDLKGRSVFYHHVERLRQCAKIEHIYLATSKSKENQPLIEEAQRYGISYYAGAEEDLLERYTTIAKKESADVVVRCGCDKPLLSYEIINRLLEEFNEEDLLYVSTPLPRGIGSEVLATRALTEIRKYYRGPAISRYIFEYPHRFKIRGIEVDDEFSRPELRLTLDTSEDYQLIQHLYNRFYEDGKPASLREIFRYLDDHPALANMNRLVEDKQVNVYLRELTEKPTFSVYQNRHGKYVVKNRMQEIIAPEDFKKIISNLEWENV